MFYMNQCMYILPVFTFMWTLIFGCMSYSNYCGQLLFLYFIYILYKYGYAASNNEFDGKIKLIDTSRRNCLQHVIHTNVKVYIKIINTSSCIFMI